MPLAAPCCADAGAQPNAVTSPICDLVNSSTPGPTNMTADHARAPPAQAYPATAEDDDCLPSSSTFLPCEPPPPPPRRPPGSAAVLPALESFAAARQQQSFRGQKGSLVAARTHTAVSVGRALLAPLDLPLNFEHMRHGNHTVNKLRGCTPRPTSFAPHGVAVSRRLCRKGSTPQLAVAVAIQ